MAEKGHFLTQRPQPMQIISEMKQILSVLLTSQHYFPVLLTGHVFAHSREHFFGLHLSGLIIAILNFSVSIPLYFECFNFN
jgi:hypothetical protein